MDLQGQAHALSLSDQNGSDEKEDSSSVKFRLIREKNKSLEMKMAVEAALRKKEKLIERISKMEGEMGKKAVENAMSHVQHIPEEQRGLTTLHNQLERLTQENHYLFNEVSSVQSKLEAREQDLTRAKNKLHTANAKIKDLERALITERLTYEKNLKKPLTANSAVNTNSDEVPESNGTVEEEYHTALQGECDESPEHDELDSFIPTQDRSASALVRLGIEGEAVDTLEGQRAVQGQSIDIRCPICNEPALSFRDQAKFHVHVSEHFAD
jgi:DNA repair exonuclease SbcCD ATPase subunit